MMLRHLRLAVNDPDDSTFAVMAEAGSRLLTEATDYVNKGRLLAQGRPFVRSGLKATEPAWPTVQYWFGGEPCCRQLSRRGH
jgi:hypothetical protein